MPSFHTDSDTAVNPSGFPDAPFGHDRQISTTFTFTHVSLNEHPLSFANGEHPALHACWFLPGCGNPVLATGYLATDETAFAILSPDDSVLRTKPIGTSPAGQTLYGRETDWWQTSRGWKLGTRFGNAFIEQRGQPDLAAALRYIDRGGVTSTSTGKLHGGGKFEKALEKWIEDGKAKYPDHDWESVRVCLERSKKSPYLLDATGIPEPSHLEAFVEHLKHVKEFILIDSANPSGYFSILPKLPKLWKLDLSASGVTDENLNTLPHLPSLEILVLSNTGISGKSMKVIARCSGLKTLNLNDCRNVTDQGFSAIRTLQNLIHLYLSNTGISNDTMAQIGKLEKLCKLRVNGTKVSEKCASSFALLKNLTSIDLSNTKAGNKVMEAIAALPKIQTLLIEKTEVQAQGLAHLANCRTLCFLNALDVNLSGFDIHALSACREKLKLLCLDATHLSNADIEQIGKFRKLKLLGLDGPAVSDDNIHYLTGLRLLETLALVKSRISDQSIEIIQQFRKLNACSLTQTPISDSFISAFGNMPDLQYLFLNKTAISDSGIEAMAKLPNLRNIETLELDETPVTAKGLAILSTFPKLRELSLANSKISKLPAEFLTSFSKCAVNLTGIDFSEQDLEILQRLKDEGRDIRFGKDEGGETSDGATGMTAFMSRAQLSTISASEQTAENDFNQYLEQTSSSTASTTASSSTLKGSQQRRASVLTLASVISTTPTVIQKTRIITTLQVKRQDMIENQLDDINQSDPCSRHFEELKKSLLTIFRAAQVHRTGISPYQAKIETPANPANLAAGIVEAATSAVPGIAVVGSTIGSAVDAVHAAKFGRWAESMSRLLDASGDVEIFADTLARAIALWHKDDIADPVWVVERLKSAKKKAFVDKLEGRGKDETAEQSRIRQLAVKQAKWLVKQMVDDQSDLARAVAASVEMAVSGGAKQWDTDAFKIEPILLAHAERWPGKSHRPIDGIRELFVWGKRNPSLTFCEVNDRVLREQARRGFNDLTAQALVSEPEGISDEPTINMTKGSTMDSKATLTADDDAMIEISRLKEELAGMGRKYSTLETEHAELKSQYSDLRSEFSEMQRQMTELMKLVKNNE